MNTVTVAVSRRGFRWFQFGVVTALVALGTFHYLYYNAFGVDMITRATSMFDLSREDSLPTAFSIINLLIAAALLFALYRHSKSCGERTAIYWLILSAIGV